MTEMSEPAIRLATPEDAPALLAIYEPYVRQTAITCEYEVPSVRSSPGASSVRSSDIRIW